MAQENQETARLETGWHLETMPEKETKSTKMKGFDSEQRTPMVQPKLALSLGMPSTETLVRETGSENRRELHWVK